MTAIRSQTYGAARSRSLCVRVAGGVVIALTVALIGCSMAGAPEAPGWELYARTYPTNLRPARTRGEVSGTVAIDVFNIGASAAVAGEASSSEPITITD